ncbi:MAG: glycosyltransferase [Bacteroidota bacterium]
MKILVLTSRFPYPLERGDKLRVYHQIRYLSREHKVVLCALNDQPITTEDFEAVEPFCEKIFTFKLSKLGIGIHLLGAFFSGKPLQVAYFHRSALQKQIWQVIQKEHPDVIYCQLPRMAAYMDGHPHTVKALDYMDAFSAGMERRAERTSGPLKWIWAREARKLKVFEADLEGKFALKTIISRQDRTLLPLKKPNEVRIVPNGVDTTFFTPGFPSNQSVDLVYVGNMSYFPNVRAAHFLVKELLPILPADIRLQIAGANPSASVKALASSQVSVSGWLSDIRTAYASGQIFVAPLFTGTGQQNKILEAMAMGIPCVTTELVNNAIGASPNKHVLIADTAQAFSNQIQLLRQHPDLAGEMATQARKFVQEHFSWEASTRKLAGWMAECLDTHDSTQ